MLRRSGALGDVVLATAVLRRLRRENPESHIIIQTGYPEVFQGNPHIGAQGALPNDDVQFIDLDFAYEKRPHMHIVEAYMQEAFGGKSEPADWLPELFIPESLKMRLPDPAYTIAIHAAVAGWRNRTLPRKSWKSLIDSLKSRGLTPLLVGLPRDGVPNANCIHFDNPNLMAQAAVIRECRAFIGSDSALLHVASAVGTPTVGIFTCADSYLRMPRTGLHYGVTSRTDCTGCLHRRIPPATTEFCEKGTIECVDNVNMIQVEAKLQDILLQVQ
jgi:ADP-heptose:LPS heptosyltransferase